MTQVKAIMDADKFAPVVKFGNQYFIQFDAETSEEGITTCTRVSFGTEEPTDEQVQEVINACHAEDKAKQVKALKAELSSYDYIGVKIATGVATIADYADQIAYCEQLRQQIRDLEK